MIQAESSATAVMDILQVSWIQGSSFTVNPVAVPDHIQTRLKDLIE
jgi:hypothetical protein